MFHAKSQTGCELSPSEGKSLQRDLVGGFVRTGGAGTG